MSHHSSHRGSFRGSLGFVLATAGSAVGLGNIWRFPYLAARDGGGLFLLVYLVLAVTFGFSMMTTEISIGRITRKSALSAYPAVHPKAGWIGMLASVVPMMILPYYCAIGGWVLKYLAAFLSGQGAAAAQPDYFSGFIAGRLEPPVFMLVFVALCAVVVFLGVDKGIEKVSKLLMPLLVLLIVGIAVYSLTLRGGEDRGVSVTGLDGLRVFLVPDFSGLTPGVLFHTVVDAVTQLFFSLSISMGICVAYGSYVPDDTNLPRSIGQIEIFDTLVAVLAGVMIIPAVYVFMGPEGMETGPSLMFVSLPKTFAAMGPAGGLVGTVFFAMVLFAAVTSGFSIMEAIVSSLMDWRGWSRRKAAAVTTAEALVIGLLVCLGYNDLFFRVKLPNGQYGQILDVLDFVSNNLLMPVCALATCVLIGWVVKPDRIIRDVTRNGEPFRRKPVYVVMVRFIAPVLLVFILLSSFNVI